MDNPIAYTLLLVLSGPMQSWGGRTYTERTTNLTPTKSGVVGLIAAVLGRRRDEDISDLATLRMGVRVDRAGLLETEFITGQNIISADGTKVHASSSTVKHYLADAVFLVGLEGARWTLESIRETVEMPRFPLYLGRRGYVADRPIYLSDGFQQTNLESSLREYELVGPRRTDAFEVEVEVTSGGDLVFDQPIGPRRFGPRRVKRYRLWRL